MINYESLKTWLIILFAAGPLIMGTILIAHILYMIRLLPTMLRALENSSFIVGLNTAFSHAGLIGKFMMVGQIAGFVVHPKTGIKGGFISADDIENFPPRILKMLKINITMMNITTIWGLIFYAALKLELLD